MRVLTLAFVLLAAGCDNPTEPDGRWLVVQTEGAFEGIVSFEDGRVMRAEGDRNDSFPLNDGERLCWAFDRPAAPGYLRVYVDGPSGREATTETKAVSGRIAGCV